MGPGLVPASHGEEYFALMISTLMTTHEAGSLFSHFTDEKLNYRTVTYFHQDHTAGTAGQPGPRRSGIKGHTLHIFSP